jgi:valyl-tRNA synthetase
MKLKLKKMSKLKLKKRPIKSKFNFLKSRLAQYITIGLTLEDACKLAEVSNNTLGLLRTDPEFEEFVQKSKVNSEYEHLQAIHSAAQFGQWQASAWYLERTRPEKYGRRDIVRHEYQIKFQTLQKVFIEVLDEVDPYLKIKLLKRLKSYEFDGSQLLGGPKSASHLFIESSSETPNENGD